MCKFNMANSVEVPILNKYEIQLGINVFNENI